MNKKTYNFVLDLITFLACVVFTILKFVGIIEYSWFAMGIFILINILFREPNNNDNNNNERTMVA